MKPTYKIGDRLNVTVLKIVPQGYGIAFAEGLTVFVPLSAPGDEVEVVIREIKKRIAFAEIASVVTHSPMRAVPPCPYFGTCGGCDFQQMTYSAQVESKVGIIRDALARIGKIEFTGEIGVIESPRELRYRSRAQWHFEPATKAFGYFRRNSHEVIDAEICPILTPDLEDVLKRVRSEMPWEAMNFDIGDVEAAVGDAGAVSVVSDDVAVGVPEDIHFTAFGTRYSYSAETFFQGNQLLVEALIEAASGGASGEFAVDLYCGVGLFSLSLAKRFSEVFAVEDYAKAVEFAVRNAEAAGLNNIEFEVGNVDRVMRSIDLGPVDLLLLDPPRSGADVETVKRIAEAAPKQISYVSCDPSILARDLRILLDRGYFIDTITALDLFPQTHHVETVVRLTRS